MKNFTILTMLLLVAFMSKAQKSALTPTTFSLKDKALITSVLDFDNNENVLEDKARAIRFKNMTVDRDSTYYDVETPASFLDGQESLKSLSDKILFVQRIQKAKLF